MMAKTHAIYKLRQHAHTAERYVQSLIQQITYNMKRLFFILPALMLISCSPKNDYETILLRATGTVEIAPDEASIIINASCIDRDINQAKDCLIKITSDLNESLSEFGIQKEDILTTNVNLNKGSLWINNSEVFRRSSFNYNKCKSS